MLDFLLGVSEAVFQNYSEFGEILKIIKKELTQIKIPVKVGRNKENFSRA